MIKAKRTSAQINDFLSHRKPELAEVAEVAKMNFPGFFQVSDSPQTQKLQADPGQNQTDMFSYGLPHPIQPHSITFPKDDLPSHCGKNHIQMVFPNQPEPYHQWCAENQGIDDGLDQRAKGHHETQDPPQFGHTNLKDLSGPGAGNIHMGVPENGGNPSHPPF